MAAFLVRCKTVINRRWVHSITSYETISRGPLVSSDW